MLYSASWNESFIRSGGSTESMYLKAHLMRVLIGFVFMFIFDVAVVVIDLAIVMLLIIFRIIVAFLVILIIIPMYPMSCSFLR